MSITVKQDHNKYQLERVIELLNQGSMYEMRNFIHSIYPAETANIISALDIEERKQIWTVIPINVMGEILVKLNTEIAASLIQITDRNDLIQAIEKLESDDMVDLLHTLPEPTLSNVLESIGVTERRRLESALSFADNTAGGLMSLDVLTISPDVSLDVVSRYLRKRGNIPTGTDGLYVIDNKNQLKGILPIDCLLTEDLNKKVSAVMQNSVDAVPYQMPASEVALLFEQHNMLSTPVLTETGKLLGRITLDDIIGVIRGEEEHAVMQRVGLDEKQDLFAPAVTSSKRRGVWLGINLFTAFLASWVIGLFEATLDQIVALAVLMPIVASMGGIAGSQTLTLVIRGLALKQVNMANASRLLTKELAVGAVNGVLWASIVALIASLWFQSASLGILLGSAMIINLLCAALAGTIIPLALDKVGIDPALAGGVLLTTVTDVIGFMAFLGLATIFLI